MFLPDDWDEQTVQTDDDDDETIWHRLYWWLHLYHGCELEGIFRKVYVGYELHERLLRMERERIKKKYKLTGTKLTKETMWSNFNYGPKISVENYGKIIKGNVLFFLKNEEDADEIET